MHFDVIAEGLAFPEGPIVMPDGSVVFVEILGGRLSRAWGDGRTEVIAELGGGPNGAQLGPDGAVYVCNNGGTDLAEHCHLDTPEAGGRIERVDLRTGKYERVYDRCGDFLLRAPNDLVFDAQGNFWFTDMGKQLKRSADYSGLYHAAPNGASITQAYFGGVSFNGVGLSGDETTLFVSDTKTARIHRFDLEAPGHCATGSDGQVTPGYLATVPGPVWLDSFAVLESGSLAVATIFNGGITTVDLDGAAAHTPFPDLFTTNIAFGGEDMRTAVVTLGMSGRLVRTRWPEPGLRLNFGQY